MNKLELKLSQLVLEAMDTARYNNIHPDSGSILASHHLGTPIVFGYEKLYESIKEAIDKAIQMDRLERDGQ